MKEKIKKILLLLIPIFVLSLFILLPFDKVEARQGCCSWHGGVCGCQCCDGTPLSSTCLPYYPECGGGFYNPPSYPSIPSCPLNSYYDSITNSCKCYSGYVVSEGQCISANQWCRDKYGLWATYDYLTDGCKCMSGYIFGKDVIGNTACISADQYCKDLYGFNARYNILSDSCECSYGYVLSGGSCVDPDTLCHQKYGYNSSYDSLTDKCKCNYGYVFNSSNQCVSEDEYCRDLYGLNAKYNILTDKCECSYGYVVDETGTNCVLGNTYCYNKYGYHSNYDALSKKCECNYGYIFSNNQCIDEDTYCHNQYGAHSSYNTLTSSCVCDYGYKLINNICVTPKISSIFPLEVKIGEEVTIMGENFGDSKYGDLKLYVDLLKINSLDISKWQNDKIVFDVTDNLESGNVILKDNTINVRSSYLEILKPEKNQISIPSSAPTQEKPVATPQPTITTPQQTNEPKPQPEAKTIVRESQPEVELQPTSQEQNQQQVSNEQKPEQKKSLFIFLASVLDAVKNFFSQLFK